MRINVLILMGGKGVRFAEAGFKELKPMIKAGKKTLIKIACSGLKSKKYDTRFIFSYAPEQDSTFRREVKKNEPDSVIVLDKIMAGMATGALVATDYIDNDEPLLVASCDQNVRFNIDEFYDYALKSDGCLLTTKSNLPNRSYCKLEGERVIEVAEKIVISDNSNVGLYFFTKGRDFVKSAIKMVGKGIKTLDHFYMSPVYNEMLDKNITIYDVPKDSVDFIGTPQDLEKFINDNK